MNKVKLSTLLLIFLLLLSSCSDVELELQGGTTGESLSDTENEGLADSLSPISSEAFTSIERGTAYSDILSDFGEPSYVIWNSHFWKTEDGKIARLDFHSKEGSEDKVLSSEAYVFTKEKTDITRVTDVGEVSQAKICYMGDKSETIDISDDKDAVLRLVEYIKAADGEFVNSTRGYSGAPYIISLKKADGDEFKFAVWSKNCYSTNEYKDGNYNMFAYSDISELYEYLESTYDEKRFRAELIEVGMTYSEVVSWMGDDGTDIGSGAIWYQWKLSDGKHLNVWLDAALGALPSSIDEYVVTRVTIE